MDFRDAAGKICHRHSSTGGERSEAHGFSG
jgi:hypothetical protein